MTPLQISMMLHFHCSPAPFTPWSPAASEAISWFMEQGLLQEPVNVDCVRLSPRGSAYVHFLTTMPLPTDSWSIPGSWSPSLPGATVRAAR